MTSTNQTLIDGGAQSSFNGAREWNISSGDEKVAKNEVKYHNLLPSSELQIDKAYSISLVANKGITREKNNRKKAEIATRDDFAIEKRPVGHFLKV